MLTFLLAVLVFALGVGLSGKSAVTPEEIIENLDDVVANVESPQGNPQIPPSNNQNRDGNNNQNTGGQNANSANNGNLTTLDTTQVATTNQASEKQVEVAQVAVDASPVLGEVDERNPIAQNTPAQGSQPENVGQPADKPNENAGENPANNASDAQSNNPVFGGQIPANEHAASNLPN